MVSTMMTPATSRIGRDARLLCDPLGIALLEALMSLANLDTSERVAVCGSFSPAKGKRARVGGPRRRGARPRKECARANEFITGLVQCRRTWAGSTLPPPEEV